MTLRRAIESAQERDCRDRVRRLLSPGRRRAGGDPSHGHRYFERWHAHRLLAERLRAPLVVVHGTTADHTRCARLLPALERRFTVIVMDRRGRWGSGDTADHVIHREFEDVAAVIEDVGEPVILLGHSYGGICSLEAALLTDKEPCVAYA